MGSLAIPESQVDVLIIGAGPAGLMCATWMSRYGIKTRIIDKRGTKVFNGQADGLNCRTLEIFDSFGFADRVWREANHMLEICFWNPDKYGVIQRSERISDTIPGSSRFQQVVLHQGRIERFLLDSLKGHSDIVVERGVLPERLEIDQSIINEPAAYPVTVKIRQLNDQQATPEQTRALGSATTVQDGLFRSNLAPDDTEELLRASEATKSNAGTEIIRAKYVVGCDGAHSWTRKQLGYRLEGEQTDYLWGVLDIIPITDFPDIRVYSCIHSADQGSVMVIPRENKLVRLYTQINTTCEDGSPIDRSKINPGIILTAAQKIMRPYKISYKYCDWWTAYQVGQRVGSNFSASDRVFLAGDAVHTHSPKAGQGMNVSMQDTYNLGWKIASVVKGRCHQSILKTYEPERRPIAKDLINFDYKLSRLFSGRPARDILDQEGISLEEFRKELERGNIFGSGLGVDYDGSILVAKKRKEDGKTDAGSKRLSTQAYNGRLPIPGNEAKEKADIDSKEISSYGILVTEGSKSQHSGIAACSSQGMSSSASGAGYVGTVEQVKMMTGRQELASNIRIGMRMPSYQVMNQSDARPWQFQEMLRSDGRWRIVVFAGDISRVKQAKRVNRLGEALDRPGSLIRRVTPSIESIDSVVEVLTVHSAPRREIDLFDLHATYHPFSESEGWDYNKVYVDDMSYHEGHGHAYENYGVDPSRGCMIVVRPDQYVSWIGHLEEVDEMEHFFWQFMLPQNELTCW